MLEALSALIISTLSITYLTNPFSSLSVIRLPYRIKLNKLTHETINTNHRLKVRSNIFWKSFAWLQCGIYILSTRYLHQPRSTSSSVTNIIKDIHTLRFNPNKLLLISGDHFNGLFVRNLGVFYYPMLDGNVYTSEKDWRKRQEVYLQSVAYALGSFAKRPVLTTTIVATGPYATTNINFYSYPSDSLYGILYALASLHGVEHSGADLYHIPKRRVDTIDASQELLEEYRTLLQKLYHSYKKMVFDETTNLIRTDIHLSGAKDITKRRCAFYDNVIFWKTSQLAMKLGVIPEDAALLDTLKSKILSTFWSEKRGHFLEDLSKESNETGFYSSDWLIVLSTGFLDIENEDERLYYLRSLKHIKKYDIARPFAIKYHNDTRAHRQFLPVRLAVASYGGDSIWSFWGMEYIKVCLLLAKYTGDKTYQTEANYHIKTYEENIIKFKGFPEVYDKDGAILQTLLYRSICMTGWVIGFEQVLMMRKELSAT